MEITQEKREKLLRMAYKNGYEYFEHSHIDIEDIEHISVLCSEGYGEKSLERTYREIESVFGFERGKHDWDNFGIYPIIEDASVCYEAGARDALEDNENNPERISHMWD